MIISKKLFSKILFHAFLLVFSFIMFYPVLWLISSSFKSTAEIVANPSSLLPSKVTFSNWINGWKGFGGVTFGTFMLNSLFVSSVSTVLQVAFSALVAYGFARNRFKGKNILFTIMILTLLLPSQILLVPQFIMFSRMGLRNSYLPLLLPTMFGLPFFIFMIMQFIKGIPVELDEAANIDGCNKYTIFGRIIMPLLIPALITSAIFAFYWKWQEVFEPLLYLQKADKFTVSIAVKMFADPNAGTDWGAIYAMSVASIIPVLLIFICFQKYLVEGIATTGLKS